jgi:hypothetical protein
MHRSRLSLLVIVASVGGCSTRRDESDGKKVLSQDPALAAQVDSEAKTTSLPLPDACRATVMAAAPASANKSQAEKLTREGYSAEMLGNLQRARELLSRASELDGTDKSAAYHLGRTNEALGDHDAATSAYCRFLKLTTVESAESAEARQRVATLSKSNSRVASGNVGSRLATRPPASARTTTRRAMREPATPERRVVSAPVRPSSRVTQPSAKQSGGVASNGNVDLPSKIDAPRPSTRVDSSGGADVVATSVPAATVDQPSPSTQTADRRPTRVQSAAIGAVTGAIVGAATGRSVKAAVIGGAAGGILGTAVGRGGRRYSDRDNN